MHAAYQEDPIMLATIVKNLCSSFGRISKVSFTKKFFYINYKFCLMLMEFKNEFTYQICNKLEKKNFYHELYALCTSTIKQNTVK